MQRNEELASTQLVRFQQDIKTCVAQFHGSVIDFYGDGALCSFPNPLEAIHCAMNVQKAFQESPKIPMRIGIHSGTVIMEGDKIYGDTINLASRIESMGVPNSILFSKVVRDELKNHPNLKMNSLGIFDFKKQTMVYKIF